MSTTVHPMVVYVQTQHTVLHALVMKDIMIYCHPNLEPRAMDVAKQLACHLKQAVMNGLLVHLIPRRVFILTLALLPNHNFEGVREPHRI